MLENGNIIDFDSYKNIPENIGTGYKIILESNFLPEFNWENIYILLFLILGFFSIFLFSFLSRNKK